MAPPCRTFPFMINKESFYFPFPKQSINTEFFPLITECSNQQAYLEISLLREPVTPIALKKFSLNFIPKTQAI